jgi:hypothetical protein
MAATASETVGGQPSAAQVEELLRVCEGLQRALARSRGVRRILLIGTLAFVIFICVMFYSLGKQLSSDEYRAKVQALAQERLQSNSSEYMNEIQALADHARPVLYGAFMKQAEKDMPTYMHAIGQERELLVKELEQKGTDRLHAHYGKVLDRHKALLEKEFPTIKDEEVRKRMMGNLHLAVEKLVKKYYIDDMRKEFLGLYDSWDQFPRAEPPKAGDPEHESVLTGMFVELLQEAITSNPQAPKS